MTVATGHSHDPDSADAIAAALDACADALGEKTPQAGLLFCGIDHDFQALLDGVEARHPGLQLIGCTTHGELSPEGFAEDSVALMLLQSDRVQFRAGVAETDVFLTADGHVVVLHDETLDRTTNGTGPIAEHTLAQLQGQHESLRLAQAESHLAMLDEFAGTTVLAARFGELFAELADRVARLESLERGAHQRLAGFH